MQSAARTMLRSALLAVTLLSATARVARADGWWEACNDSNGGGCADGMGGTSCSCETARDAPGHGAAKIGSSLALLAVVAYGIGRRRNRRSR